MKGKYNFANAERGKFYRSPVELDIPIYLAADVIESLQKLAAEEERDINEIANTLLRNAIAPT